MARPLRFRLGPRVPAIICVAALPAALLAGRIGWAWALAAGLAAGGIAARVLLGRAPGVLHAIGDALDSLREHDYAARIDERSSGSLRRSRRASTRSPRRCAWSVATSTRRVAARTVLETAPTAMVVSDETETIVIANNAARDLLGDGRRLRLAPAGGARSVRSRSPRRAAGHPGGPLSVERKGETETFMAVSRWFELNSRRHRVYLLRPVTRS
jgi:PAS domain-containing protein